LLWVGFPPYFVFEGVEIPLVNISLAKEERNGRVGAELKFYSKSRQTSRQANSIAYCERGEVIYPLFTESNMYSLHTFRLCVVV
jgi:hypothetical protein